MLIELESVYGDKIIRGKQLTQNELQSAIKEILENSSERDFISVFCLRFGYEELLYTDSVQVDYRIDLDSHSLIKPQY